LAAVGVLGVLAVPAFLLGAGLGGESPSPERRPNVGAAPGRAALDQAPADPNPAATPRGSQARDAALRAASTPLGGAPVRPGEPAGLTVEVVALDATPTADELVQFRVRWTDASGRYAGLTEEWGDGTAASSVDTVECAGEPGAHRGELTTAHRFAAGDYRVRISVTTARCDGRTETRTGEVTVRVRSADPHAESPSEADGTGSSRVPLDPDSPAAAPPGSSTGTSLSPAPIPSLESLGNP
jgi:hypothetical protein